MVVPAGSTTLNVDETDPDFPPQATETTAVDGTQWAAPHTWTVGYVQPPLIITKRSSAGGTVFPGQRVAYTVTVTNNTSPAVAQTQVNLADVLPAGMTYVPGTAGVVSATNGAIRVTEYQIPTACGGFGNAACTVTLANPLATNYFAILQGSAAATPSNPVADYAAITNDGVAGGSGDFTGGLATNQMILTRGSGASDWAGVLTVVECTLGAACATDPNGFQLLTVENLALPAASATGSDSSWAGSWGTDLSHLMLLGGPTEPAATPRSTPPPFSTRPATSGCTRPARTRSTGRAAPPPSRTRTPRPSR